MPKSQVNVRAILRIALLCMYMFSLVMLMTSCVRENIPLNLATYKPSDTIALNNNEVSDTSLKPDSLNDFILKNQTDGNNSIFANKKTEVGINHTKNEVVIGAVGDIMFHNVQLYRAYDYTSKTFDFTPIFKYMEPYLKANDLTFGNLETTLHGPKGNVNSSGENNIFGYSAYPNFNTPDSALEPILSAGFDFLSTGNNHSLDLGYDGMIRTIEKLDAVGIRHTGTFLNLESRKQYETIETNGIKFAVVNYTYGTNGINIGEEGMQLINTLDIYKEENLERLYSDIEAAENSDADFVIAMLHYGNEYWEHEDSRFQKPVTLEVIKRGADIVFGGHPHTIQPIDIIYEVDDMVYNEPKVIIYSLGNFLASQRNIASYDAPTDLGVMFNVYFETIDGENPKITGVGFLPTYTTWQSDVIATMPVTEDISLIENENLDLDDYSYSNWDISRINVAKEYVVNHLMKYVIPKGLVNEVYNDQGIYRFDIIK